MAASPPRSSHYARPPLLCAAAPHSHLGYLVTTSPANHHAVTPSVPSRTPSCHPPCREPNHQPRVTSTTNVRRTRTTINTHHCSSWTVSPTPSQLATASCTQHARGDIRRQRTIHPGPSTLASFTGEASSSSSTAHSHITTAFAIRVVSSTKYTAAKSLIRLSNQWRCSDHYMFRDVARFALPAVSFVFALRLELRVVRATVSSSSPSALSSTSICASSSSSSSLCSSSASSSP